MSLIRSCIFALFLIFLMFLGKSCKNVPEQKISFIPMELPSGNYSVFPNLLSNQSKLLLSWVDEHEEGTDKLMYSEWENGAWSVPQIMAQGSNWFINWADFPGMGVNASGDKFAHYLARSAEGTYDYDVRLVWQKNGEAQWSEMGKPYQDTTKGEHGFVSMFPAPDNQLGVVWLDGRKYVTKKEEMMLMFSLVDAEGNVTAEKPLDERVCDCCQTDAVSSEDRTIVVYRNRTENEIRDIYRVIYEDGKWSEPAPVGDDQWNISGCPVNGPAIDARGNHVVVAWFTNAGDSARVKLAFSENGGESFGPPMQLDLGNPLGRIDVKLDETGNAWISWMENVEKEAQIFLRKIDKNGFISDAFSVSAINEHRASGFPRMAILEGDLYLVWTKSGEPSSLEMVKAKNH